MILRGTLDSLIETIIHDTAFFHQNHSYPDIYQSKPSSQPHLVNVQTLCILRLIFETSALSPWDWALAGDLGNGQFPAHGFQRHAALELAVARLFHKTARSFLKVNITPFYTLSSVQFSGSTAANLPVNGDAELVYALEAQKGHGSLLDQGGLDREKVTQAILDIMEGSKEAFQKRREKYHF